MSALVRTVCTYCRALIHDGVLVDGRESHGACKACCDRIRQERREKYEAEAHTAPVIW